MFCRTHYKKIKAPEWKPVISSGTQSSVAVRRTDFEGKRHSTLHSVSSVGCLPLERCEVSLDEESHSVFRLVEVQRDHRCASAEEYFHEL